MGRTPKFTKAVKIQACKDYACGKGSLISIAREMGAAYSSVREWYYAYQIHGETAFNHSDANKSYTKIFKESIVNEYLSGIASAEDLGAKYNITIRTIRKWINMYYNGIEIKDYDPKGDIYTMKSRKTTFEERIEIVKWVIDNDMNYKVAADNNAIKYALIYQWVQKYLKGGAEGLKHKTRGPKKQSVIGESSLSEVERLKSELEREKALRERAEFRLELFKKKKNLHKKDALESNS